MEVQVKWLGEMRFAAANNRGQTITLDGEVKTGPSPMEAVLMGLGGCTGVDVVEILQKMRVPVKGLEIAIQTERAGDHPRVFTKINMIYRVRGAVPEDKLKRAIQLTQEKYCSVLHMLNKTALVNYTYEINP